MDGFDVCAAASASSMALRSLRNSLYSSNGSLKMYTPVGWWVWKNRIMNGEHKGKIIDHQKTADEIHERQEFQQNNEKIVAWITSYHLASYKNG